MIVFQMDANKTLTYVLQMGSDKKRYFLECTCLGNRRGSKRKFGPGSQ